MVSCTASIVRPKEGDGPDRAKYFQGITFYEPEVNCNIWPLQRRHDNHVMTVVDISDVVVLKTTVQKTMDNRYLLSLLRLALLFLLSLLK